jgi:ParB family chromosome partitioning protein
MVNTREPKYESDTVSRSPKTPAPRPPGSPKPQTVATSALEPNPHNPRMLFDAEPLKTLEASIRKVGILVPLTVYWNHHHQKYTILDGQRRWICAQNIGLAEVPVNEVPEPSLVENIVTMFQIHKLRKDWELMPTALKLGVLMEELQERRDRPLAELTGLDVAVVTRCKKLLSYSKKYQNMMLFRNPADRIKADFFIELYPIITDRIISRAPGFNKEKIIESFLHKYQNRLSGFKSITDFRKIKQYAAAARLAGEERTFIRRFDEFLNNHERDLSFLEIDSAHIQRRVKQLTKALARLEGDLKALDPQLFLGEEALWRELESLLTIIRQKLAAADRRVR